MFKYLKGELNCLGIIAFVILAASISCNVSSTHREQELVDVILVTKNLQAGQERISLLVNADLIKDEAPIGKFTIRHTTESNVMKTQTAHYHRWPYGFRGAYSADMDFIQPGLWDLELLLQIKGEQHIGRLKLDIAEKLPVPARGEMPPQSVTPTLYDVEELAFLTTDFSPDPDLYKMSLVDALQDSKPDVIVFSSPAFCTSPTCGPQVDTLSDLKELYMGEANFIHVEIYDNPSEIQGDVDRLRVVDTAEEWGFTQLPGWVNESWTFVIDGDGEIERRFEGFVTLEELESALGSVLKVS